MVLLLLLRLTLLLVTVNSPEVKSPPHPLCFGFRVCSCPILILIYVCGMIVLVHDGGLVAMNVGLEH